MKKQYFEGLLAAGRDCITCPEGLDYSAGLIGQAGNDYQRGERFALRAFRDLEEPDAIDLIASRLWKWGAGEELDRFLEFIGMDREGEPTPVQDRPALQDRLSRLWSLDRNGWAATVDGSLDELSDAEIAGILDDAFTEILADTLPPVIAYEKLSGEIIADYAEGGAR